ncbi:hypothetical protein [Priestia megaterium]|uniref:hypothetical protein n=1 Tax=Priestia megaterium TaxID=1404 RepID=UPI000BFE731B|nr:hypothetical protein [Priestia megaterium]PGO60845.1 hypothetical protein CN981_08285 [Priestia megaterium]
MKKILKSVSLFVVALAFVVGITPKAEAATTSWHSVSGYGSGCQVQAYTDNTVYKKTANTIDSYLKTNGKCKTMSYNMQLVDMNDSGFSVPERTGSFSKQTSTRTFSLDSVRKEGNSNPFKAQIRYVVGGTMFYSPVLKLYK